MHVSGAIVCQDNASTIAAVVENLAPLVDEIVAVDGGSTDGTRELLAARPDVRLFERPFDGNHARQKNFAFDRCRGRWILSVDSDELLAGWTRRRVAVLTRLPGARWYSIPRLWLVREADGGLAYLTSKPYFRDRQLRLFRNAPGFRFDEVETPTHHAFVGKHGLGRPLRRPYIYHYTFLLQDRAEREAKVARYRRAHPEAEAANRMYLWEESGSGRAALPIAPPGLLAPR